MLTPRFFLFYLAFRRFSFYIRDVAHSPAALLQELRRIDAHLAESETSFMRRNDRPDHLDCMLLPKLQHIRVAAGALRDFDIPAELTALWRYLGNAYRYLRPSRYANCYWRA